jgi:hypothetical protein
MADTVHCLSLNPSQSSIITGITEVLTRRRVIILELLSCGYTIYVEAASKYAMKTTKLAEEAYTGHTYLRAFTKHRRHSASVSRLPGTELQKETLYKAVKNTHQRRLSSFTFGVIRPSDNVGKTVMQTVNLSRYTRKKYLCV